jgi:hypothetical protein
MFCVGPSGITGTGTITAVTATGTNGGYLTAVNTSGAVALGVNLGSDATSGSFDYRYVNKDESACIKPIMIYASGVPSIGNILTITGTSPYTWAWGSTPGTGTVTNVSSANSYISVEHPTTTPILTLNTGTGGLSDLFVDENQTTINAGATSGYPGGVRIWSSNSYYTDLLSQAASANRTISFPAAAPTNEQSLVADGTAGLLKWKAVSGGTGGVTSVLPGDAYITVDNTTNPATPFVGANITGTGGFDARYINASGQGVENGSVVTGGIVQAGGGVYTAGNLNLIPDTGIGYLSFDPANVAKGTAYIGQSQSPGATDTHFWVPSTDGAFGNVLQNLGAGSTNWASTLNITSANLATTLTAGSVSIRNPGQTQSVTLAYAGTTSPPPVYYLPDVAGATAGSQLTFHGNWEPLTWDTAKAKQKYAGKMGFDNIIDYDPGSMNPEPFTILYNDSVYIADTTGTVDDYSFLAVDTTKVLARDDKGDVTVQGRVTADTLRAHMVKADSSSLHLLRVTTDGGSLGGDVFADGWVQGYGFNDEYTGHAATLSMVADTSWFHGGGWFQHRLKVGSGDSGEHPDRFTVDGQLVVTGVSWFADISALGAITGRGKLAVADSVCAHGRLISGTASRAGIIELSDGAGHKYYLKTPGMAASDTLTLPPANAAYKDTLATLRLALSRAVAANPIKFAVVDTFKLNHYRKPINSRFICEYVPGVLSTDIVTCPFPKDRGTISALYGSWICKSDSVGFRWDAGFDGEIVSYSIIRK